MRSCLLKSIGCKINQYEIQLLREQFIENGYKEVSGNKDAEVCIINTCTVTRKSDRKSRKVIENIIRNNPKARIIVTGCGVNNRYNKIKDIKGVDLFVDNDKKDKLISLIGKNYTNSTHIISSFSDRGRAFVKVQDGCDSFCSYCIVPFMRGRARSRDIEEIEEEVRSLIANGCREIVLTGIELGSFGKDNGSSLINLIDNLLSIKELVRLRLSSLNPEDIKPSLVDRIKDNHKICRHLHIAIQSADDKIIKLMNRKYDEKIIRNLIEKLIRKIPEIGLSSDFIVGFPQEEDNNFESTLKLVKDYNFVKTHIFTYSDRKMTRAYNFDKKIPLNIKKERSLKLKKASTKSAIRFKEKFIDKTLNVLVEKKKDRKTGLLCGYSDNYIKVFLENIKEDYKSKIIPVKITTLKDNSVFSDSILI